MAGPSGVTPVYQLPYPIPDDTVDVPRDVKALADKLDAMPGLVSTPASQVVVNGPSPSDDPLITGKVMMSVTMTTRGYPVLLTCSGYLSQSGTPGSTAYPGVLQWRVDGNNSTARICWALALPAVLGGTGVAYSPPPSAHIWTGLPAGQHTFDLYCQSAVGGTWYQVNGAVMTAMEIP